MTSPLMQSLNHSYNVVWKRFWILQTVQSVNSCQKMVGRDESCTVVRTNCGQWGVLVRFTKSGGCRKHGCANISRTALSVNLLLWMDDQKSPRLLWGISTTQWRIEKGIYICRKVKEKCTSAYFLTQALFGLWTECCASNNTRQPVWSGRTSFARRKSC